MAQHGAISEHPPRQAKRRPAYRRRPAGSDQVCEKQLIEDRRRAIARGLALGESVEELAERLGVLPNTVRRHLCCLYEETGTQSQAGLVGWCVANGVVTLAELQEVYAHDKLEAWSER